MTTIQQVFDRAWRAAERRSWEYGRLGRLNADASLTIAVPNRTNFYFVRLGITGEQGLTTAHNAYGVAARDNLLVKMRRENGTLVIYEADATASSGDPDGGAGTWDVGVHALGGEYHYGNLPWARVDKTGASLADLPSRAHSALSGIGPNDHHAEATAGDGISLTGQQVAVNSTVVRTTRTVSAGDGLSGGGDLSANRSFAVNSTVVRTTRTLTAGDGLSGGGDLSANRSFAVDSTVVRTSRTLSAGTGITGGGDLSANRSFAVNQAFTPTWTGVHTFNANPVIANNLSFTGARTINSNSTNALTLAPGGELVLDPGSTVTLAAGEEFRTATFSDLVTGIGGARLWDRGGNAYQMTIGGLKADELYARVFVADETRIDRGEEYWSKSFGVVQEDFVLPEIAFGVSVWFEDAAALTGDIFSAGDWLLLRGIEWGTGLTLYLIWFEVVELRTASVGGRQEWRLARRSGGTTGQTIKAGSVALDFGQSGQGWVHVNALSSGGGPFVQVGTWAGANPYTPANVTNRVRMGHLSGAVGFGSGDYGFAAGNNLGLTPATGFKGFVAEASSGAGLYNTDIEIYDGSDIILSLSPSSGLQVVASDNAIFAADARDILFTHPTHGRGTKDSIGLLTWRYDTTTNYGEIRTSGASGRYNRLGLSLASQGLSSSDPSLYLYNNPTDGSAIYATAYDEIGFFISDDLAGVRIDDASGVSIQDAVGSWPAVMGINTAAVTAAQLDIVSGAAGRHALRLKAAASPTVPVVAVQDSSGADLFAVSTVGGIASRTLGFSDDTAITIADTLVQGLILIWFIATSSNIYALVKIRSGTISPHATVIFSGGATFDTTTSDVTGTTGTDGRVTIAATTSALKIENRLGSSRTFRYQIFN